MNRVVRIATVAASILILLTGFSHLTEIGPRSELLRSPTNNDSFGWTRVSPVLSPPAMAGAMMAQSTKANRLLLFGGWDGMTALNGTWVYDPGDKTWVELHPTVRPEARGDGMMVYSQRADGFILFGGWHEETNGTYRRLGDTWWFDLKSGTWIEQHPAASPSPRSDSQVAFDAARDEMLLMGGFDGMSYLGDIWSYNSSNNNWSPRAAQISPSPRADGRMVYEDNQDRFILFGGNDFNGPGSSFHHLGDTWSYNPNTNEWRLLKTSGEPGARDYPNLVYDGGRNRVLMTAGFGNNTILSDLWALDANTNVWVNLTPIRSPPARFAAVGGFDTATAELVLFGGLANIGLLADTWHYGEGRPAVSPPLAPVVIAGIGSLIAVGLALAVLLVVTRNRWRIRRS